VGGVKSYFKVVMESDDVLVSLGYALEDGDFIANLCNGMISDNRTRWIKKNAKNHMFATLHKPLVDDLARKILPRGDVNRFLHDGISTTAQGLSSAIL